MKTNHAAPPIVSGSIPVTHNKELLAEVSSALASSFNYKSSMKKVARYTVKYFADWCVIDILDKSIYERVAAVHRNKKKQYIADKIRQEFPPDPHAVGGSGKVLRTGKTEYFAHASETAVLRAARNNRKLQKLLLKMGITSYVTTPIIADKQIYGVYTCALANGSYAQSDVVLAQDIAKRIAVTITNAKMYEKSQEEIALRDEFLNIASHELRTPLTSLHLQLQLIQNLVKNKKSFSPETISTLLKKSEQQTKKLGELITTLLDASKMNLKKLELEKEDVDVSLLIKEIIERFTPEIKQSNASVIFSNGIKVVGNWDRARIDQVITNLLDNALKYGKGKPVEIRVTSDESQAKIVVSDQGAGIEPYDLQRIFERFEQTNLAKRQGGLGLGLYIASEIVKLHGGSITVQSEVAKGSTFTVALPLT